MLPFGAFMAGMGRRSGPLDTQTLTIGSVGTMPEYRGFKTIGSATGSIVDGSFNPKAGASILGLYQIGSGSGVPLIFEVDGSVTDADWTTMMIAGVPFLRASASFNLQSSPTRGEWVWSSVTPGPFNGSGDVLVQWT